MGYFTWYNVSSTHKINKISRTLNLFSYQGHNFKLTFTVALTIPKYSSEEEKKGFRLPYIFGGPLDNEYEIESFHFHWGDKNNRGSEHTLNDMRLPLEMHIIHRNKKYRSLAEALQHPDGLCVLAFFYQVSEFFCAFYIQCGMSIHFGLMEFYAVTNCF